MSNSIYDIFLSKCPKCGSSVHREDGFCGRCGSLIVESIRCPVCGGVVNPTESTCSHCKSKLLDLVINDLKKKDAILNYLSETDEFDFYFTPRILFKLAKMNSIVGLVSIRVCESNAVIGEDYDHFSLLVYDEGASPDEWDNPVESFFDPKKEFKTKADFIENLKKESNRPNFDLLTWITIYIRTNTDTAAFELSTIMSSLYEELSLIYDEKGKIVSECGILLKQWAYELENIIRNKYPDDISSKNRFKDCRYDLALNYYFVEQNGFNEDDSSLKFLKTIANGNELAWKVISQPVSEDSTKEKLLRGLLKYLISDDETNNVFDEFFAAWNEACNDSSYLDSDKGFKGEMVFYHSARLMAALGIDADEIPAAMTVLRFAFSHINYKVSAENLKEMYSHFKQDEYGNYVYVE